jgi:thiol-disulfide isomerase/thioredoxin
MVVAAGICGKLHHKPCIMKQLLSFLLLCCSFGVKAQQIPAYSAKDIISHTSSKDTLYIINFWATWCAPCVAELPEFNTLYRRYEKKPVKILLVSLDFKENYPDKLARFVDKKGLKPQVAWMSDTDPNSFIPTLEPSWEGSIPATIIVHPGKNFKKFIEGSITAGQVSGIADKLLAR